MENENKQFSNEISRLKSMRIAKGKTQMQVASTGGITQTQVSQIETGKNVTLGTLAGYLHGLNAHVLILPMAEAMEVMAKRQRDNRKEPISAIDFIGIRDDA